MIPVTRPYLPCREKLDRYFDGIYARHWLTNNGELVKELTRRLEMYLDVENLLLVGNGTLALQIAYRALGVSGASEESRAEAITTPFSFVATSSSLKWEGVTPVFADISCSSWCLNPEKIKDAITSNTRAIVPVHVFGNACDVDAIGTIAADHKLKLIYDASHAFNVKFRGKSLLRWGDAATLSFHATKLFHTAEGGAIVFSRRDDYERAMKMINFGITGPNKIAGIGINAKMSELQAAMGLCVLDEIEQNIADREAIWNRYHCKLKDHVQVLAIPKDLSYNFSYFPAVFSNEKQALAVMSSLKENDILARRYFHPSLDTVSDLGVHNIQPISRDISSRILCLPIYSGLDSAEQDLIIRLVRHIVSPDIQGYLCKESN
jgi:dTDP-4-amino-4,6-dideoxygalactose transaminase